MHHRKLASFLHQGAALRLSLDRANFMRLQTPFSIVFVGLCCFISIGFTREARFRTNQSECPD
jgi:hypothetical protein